MAKLLALEPKANAIESSIITALVLTAVFASLLAIREPISMLYSSFVGDVVVGTR